MQYITLHSQARAILYTARDNDDIEMYSWIYIAY